MEEEKRMTKKELKALRRLEKLENQKQETSQAKIKWLVLGFGALLFIAFFGSIIFLAKQKTSTQKPVVLSNSGWVRGATDATVTLVEFGDFQCPACKAYYPTVQGLLTAYKDKKFRLIFKHFPLTTVHKNAFAAAMAAESAGAQGKFFEMHDTLYERQDEWAELPAVEAKNKFISYADELKLDKDKFIQDTESSVIQEKIRSFQDEGVASGVSGTPTFFLNGKILENPRSLEDFKKLIDQELK